MRSEYFIRRMYEIRLQEDKTEKVEVKGIVCEFYDMRIDRATVPDGKYLYEVAGDDDSGAEPARVGKGVLVNFYGSLICNQPLLLEEKVMWLETGEFKYV